MVDVELSLESSKQLFQQRESQEGAEPLEMEPEKTPRFEFRWQTRLWRWRASDQEALLVGAGPEAQ